MARKARIQSQSGIYHVLVRGNANLDLFTDDEDTTYYVQLLQDLNTRGLARIYAYSLHPTHIHLLVQEGPDPQIASLKEESIIDHPSSIIENKSLIDHPSSIIEPIGAIMRRLASSYAYYYNVKYDHYGPIYQDRFKSQPVETRPFFLRVLDFILTQPVDAKAPLIQEIPSESSFIANNPSSFIEDNRVSSNHIITYSPRVRRITSSLLLSYLRQHHSFTDPTEFLQRPTEEQNRIISDCRHQGGSVRQLARLTGIPYQQVFQAK